MVYKRYYFRKKHQIKGLVLKHLIYEISKMKKIQQGDLQDPQRIIQDKQHLTSPLINHHRTNIMPKKEVFSKLSIKKIRKILLRIKSHRSLEVHLVLEEVIEVFRTQMLNFIQDR